MEVTKPCQRAGVTDARQMAEHERDVMLGHKALSAGRRDGLTVPTTDVQGLSCVTKPCQRAGVTDLGTSN